MARHCYHQSLRRQLLCLPQRARSVCRARQDGTRTWSCVRCLQETCAWPTVAVPASVARCSLWQVVRHASTVMLGRSRCMLGDGGAYRARRAPLARFDGIARGQSPGIAGDCRFLQLRLPLPLPPPAYQQVWARALLLSVQCKLLLARQRDRDIQRPSLPHCRRT